MSAAAMPPAQSFVVPASSTIVQPAAGGVTYAGAPVTVGSVTYGAPVATAYAAAQYAVPAASYSLPAAGSVTYAAAPISNTVTYAAPTAYAAPLPSQESFTISPERFQRILAGEPLSAEEIANMSKSASVPAAPAGQTATTIALAPASATAAEIPKVPTAISNRSLASVQSEDEPGVLQFLNESPYIVQAERVPDKKAGKEAFATLPLELTGKVPEDYKKGNPLIFKGPDGDIEVDVPAGMDLPLGETVTYRLKPQAEVRIQVPEGRQAGETIQFRRGDGLEIEVEIPEGVEEGDYFDADPPAVMVKVPENTVAGEQVTFQNLRRDGKEITEWCRAAVPQGVASGKFFIARLPPPEKPDDSSDSETDSPKKAEDLKKKKKVVSQKKQKACC